MNNGKGHFSNGAKYRILAAIKTPVKDFSCESILAK
jgi:hypothetical protein